MTKRKEAIDLLKKGKIKESLKIFKGFSINFTKDEQKTINRAYEMHENKNFYESLGYSFEKELESALNAIYKNFSELK